MDDNMDYEDQTAFAPSLKRKDSTISESSMDYEDFDDQDGDDISGGCESIPIDETVLRGIKQYLVEEFIRIAHKFSISEPWPKKDQLAELVRRASDVRIYAQTVIRFLDEPQFDPRTRLQLLLARGGEITDATESLDALYSTILSIFPPMPTLPAFVDILRAAVGGINPEDIDDLMQLPSGTARYSLRRLSSLLLLPPAREGSLRRMTRFHHPSLTDYLRNPDRSKEFWVYTKEADARMLDRTTHFLSVQDPLLRHPVSDYLSERLRRLSVCAMLGASAVNPEFLHRVIEPSFQRSLSSVQAQYREPFVGLLTGRLVAPDDAPLAQRLIEYTDDFRFVWNFEVALWLEPVTGPPLPPQPQLDAAYLHLLSMHPPILRFIRTVLAWQHILNRRHTVPMAMQVSEVSWFDLRPVCLLRDCVKIPFSLNESPVEFLLDPQRAGGLFRDPETLAQEASISMIQYMRAILEAENRRPARILNGLNWAIIITSCKPCPIVLQELKTLDPILFCRYADEDPEIHFRDHESRHAPSKQHFDTIIGCNSDKVCNTLSLLDATWFSADDNDLLLPRSHRRQCAERRIRQCAATSTLSASGSSTHTAGSTSWGSDGSMIPAAAGILDPKSVTAALTGPISLVLKIEGWNVSILQGELIGLIMALTISPVDDATSTLYTDHLNSVRLIDDSRTVIDQHHRLRTMNGRSYYRWILALISNNPLKIIYTRGHADDDTLPSRLNSEADHYASSAQHVINDVFAAPIPTFFMDEFTFYTHLDGWIESNMRSFFDKSTTRTSSIEAGISHQQMSLWLHDDNPLPEWSYTNAFSAYSAVVQLYARSGQLPTADLLHSRGKQNSPIGELKVDRALVAGFVSRFKLVSKSRDTAENLTSPSEFLSSDTRIRHYAEWRSDAANHLVKRASLKLAEKDIEETDAVGLLAAAKSLFIDDEHVWPLQKSVYYLGHIPKVDPLVPKLPTLAVLTRSRLVQTLAADWHTAAIRLAGRIWGD
ncbi:hypothetical protein B0H16DRAFT_1894093 [Mycena metata]|uniref:Uncharacterized protein n=1 Tax=Mycena metata TaxID=1033252 RepID=A0AAD7HUA8_9AGAR|nr:hypothetical protein B0H16DRAFT_1894093 [Mycena metata]